MLTGQPLALRRHLLHLELPSAPHPTNAAIVSIRVSRRAGPGHRRYSLSDAIDCCSGLRPVGVRSNGRLWNPSSVHAGHCSTGFLCVNFLLGSGSNLVGQVVVGSVTFYILVSEHACNGEQGRANRL